MNHILTKGNTMENGSFLLGVLNSKMDKDNIPKIVKKRTRKLTDDTLVNDPRYARQIFQSLMSVKIPTYTQVLTNEARSAILEKYEKLGKLRLI